MSNPYRDNPNAGEIFEPGYVRAGDLSDQFLAYHRSLEQLALDVQRELKVLANLAQSSVSTTHTIPCLERLKDSLKRVSRLSR